VLVPRDEARRELWSRSTEFPFSSSSRVCGKHFKESDFVYQSCKNGSKRRRLLPNAIPQNTEAAKVFTEHVSSTCGENVKD